MVDGGDNIKEATWESVSSMLQVVSTVEQQYIYTEQSSWFVFTLYWALSVIIVARVAVPWNALMNHYVSNDDVLIWKRFYWNHLVKCILIQSWFSDNFTFGFICNEILSFLGWHSHWQCTLQRIPGTRGTPKGGTQPGQAWNHQPVCNWRRWQLDRSQLVQRGVEWTTGRAGGARWVGARKRAVEHGHTGVGREIPGGGSERLEEAVYSERVNET